MEPPWVMLEGYGRAVLIGNGHTWPGRFLARLDSGEVVSVSRSDILAYGPEERGWVTGFIEGSEPSLETFAGPMSEDPIVEARWAELRTAYTESGDWWAPMYAGPEPTPRGVTGEPWTVTFGDPARWTGETWERTPLDQPLTGEWLPDTLCASRGAHASEYHDGFIRCEDCGYVIKIVRVPW